MTERGVLLPQVDAREILESLADGFLLLDGDGRCVYANRRADAIAGIASGLTGSILWDCFPQYGENDAIGRLRRALSSAMAVAYEAPLPRNGLWLAIRAAPLPGALVGVQWRDVTTQKRLEANFRAERGRFETMLEAMPQIAFVIDATGVAEYYNRYFLDYVGCPIGKDAVDRLALIHADDRPRFAAVRAERAAQGLEYTIEARIRRHDGAYRWHIVRNTPLKLPDGAVGAWLGTAVDIDDARRGEETMRRINDELEQRVERRTRDLADANARLRQSEESQRALFDKAPVPMHALDADRRVIDVNERWLELYGFEREVVIGRPISAFHATAPAELHDARWRELMATGQLREAERRFLKKSGEIFDALVSTRLETDMAGRFVRTITVTIDISARRRAEEAARRERQLSELLIESGTEGIIGLDREFRYTLWNPAMEALSGIPRGELLGKLFFDMRPDLADTEVAAAWLATMEGRRTTVRDRQYSFPRSGRIGYYEADFAPLYGPDRTTIIGGIAFLRDMTERRRIEEQLRQSQKMEVVGQLTGGVAHDFNNLLTVIIGNLDALKAQLPPQPELRRMIDAEMRASSRGATLTHSLLAFARRQPLAPQPLNLNALVSAMLDLLRRAVGEPVRLETSLAPDLWWVSADANQLESALLNLAVNARDAMPRGGILTITTANVDVDQIYAARHEEATPGPHVVIDVADTGSGMSAEVRAKAFEPFFTTKGVGQGTGLGLSQVYGFVRQSGGHVAIESELNQGTTVRLYLPRYLAAASEEVTAPAMPEALREATGDLVLMVEDDDDVREFGAEVLRDLGYRVLEAPDGPTALRVLAAEPDIRLLFTDVGLPGGLDGRQLAEEALRRRPQLKVLFTTGYARDAFVHDSGGDAKVALVTKPFTAPVLAAKIRQALDDETV